MIELTVQRGSGGGPSIKILGVGGAGANALDRLALDGVNPAHLIAANTDTQALTACVAGVKIQLGKTVTRGLGSGGDPDLGNAAAQEAAGELRAALDGVNCLFLLAGLGGGTGSGAARVVAEMARDTGALVIAVLTLPFSFEGKRRLGQAAEALAAIQECADAVVCFENDRMANTVSPKTGIQQTFAAADQTISQSVQAIVALLSRDGVIHLGFDDFRAVLHPARASGGRCLFGYGEASGDNRPYDALARAFKNPLMDKGRLLRDCESVLVQVSGGVEMTLNEVQLLMEEFNRHVGDQTRILFGAAVDPQLAGRIAVTVLSSVGAEETVGAPYQPAQSSPHPAPLSPIAHNPVPPPEAGMPEFPCEPELDAEAESSEAFGEREEAAAEPRLPFVLQTPAEPEAPEDSQVEVESPASAQESAEVETEETSEPIPPAAPAPARPPQKPTRLRPFGSATQRSLFNEFAEAQPANETPPLPERIARPVPGRTLQPSTPRAPRKPEPPEPPMPQEPATTAAPPDPEPFQPEPPSPVPPAEPVAAPAFAERPSVPATRPASPDPLAVPAPAVPKRPVPRQMEAPALPAGPAAPKVPQQETLQFEPVTRGRFEKSEPTIIDGQDLDVPTFLRRNIRIR